MWNKTSDKDYNHYDDYEEEYIYLSDIPPLESDKEEVKKG